MKSLGTINPFTAQAENELVGKILDEIQERKHTTEKSRRLPTDIPGDYLIQMAGELSLCTSEEAVDIYSHNVWPDIRSMIDSPEYLIFGSYDHVRNKTNALIQELSAEPEEMGFKLAAALSRPKVDTIVTDTLMSVFIMRLDAGFFLAGLKTLWPQIASSLIRILYNQCGLAEWDHVLSENRRKLADYSYSLRQILISTPARLDGDEFKILIDTAKADNNPNLAIVSKGIRISDDAQHLRPWQIYAVDDFFKQFFSDEMESGAIQIMKDEASLSVQIYHPDGSRYQVLFSDESTDMVEIQLPISEKYENLKGFYLFDTIFNQICINEDDDESMLVRLVGRLPLEILRNAGLTLLPGSAIQVNKSIFSSEFME